MDAEIEAKKSFLKRFKKPLIFLVSVAVIATLYFFVYPKFQSEKFTYFFPYKITNFNDLNCELTDTGSFRNLSESLSPENKVAVQNIKTDNNSIKYNFKNLDQETVSVLIGDSVGVQETKALKISDNEEVIHLIGVWGMTQEDIVTYSIYKNTGFFTYTRSGNMLFLGESLMSGYGRCL